MDEIDMSSPEEVSFALIAQAGDARSKAFYALELAKEGKFDEADAMLAEARETGVLAHRIQTELLTRAARGEKLELDLILVHAQDHLMTSILAQELIGELVEVYRRLAAAEGR